MVQTIPAERLTLHDLEKEFRLEYSNDAQFFREWQEDLPELTDTEKQTLDAVKAEFRNLSKYTVLEAIVKMVILSPLLKMAGFFQPPFNLAAEKSVEIVSEDGGTIIKGRLDLLVFAPDFWVLVVESKGLQYSIEVGIPQLLSYMMAHPSKGKPTFGFITNGSTFRFLKLIEQERPRYGQSFLFSLDSRNDLYTVARILKHLAVILG